MRSDDAKITSRIRGFSRRASFSRKTTSRCARSSPVTCAARATAWWNVPTARPCSVRRLESTTRTHGLGVDLVVSDIRMPELTGLEVLERLRGADPFMPFIVVTAFGSPETRRAAARLGAMGVLDKPFEIKDLLRLVEEAVGAAPRKPRQPG